MERKNKKGDRQEIISRSSQGHGEKEEEVRSLGGYEGWFWGTKKGTGKKLSHGAHRDTERKKKVRS